MSTNKMPVIRSLIPLAPLLLLLLLASGFTSETSAQVVLPDLPYNEDGLEPYISAETVSFHYGLHHAGYVNNLNALIAEDEDLQGLSLRQIMQQTTGTVFNNAAQVYNHNVYWVSLSPGGGGYPTCNLRRAIQTAFGSICEFQDVFTSAATGHFGSGWVWLILTETGNVDVVDSHDASNPVVEGLGTPLLTLDVWEHAYYIDYRNLRATYIENFWNLVNWDYACTEYGRLMDQ